MTFAQAVIELSELGNDMANIGRPEWKCPWIMLTTNGNLVCSQTGKLWLPSPIAEMLEDDWETDRRLCNDETAFNIIAIEGANYRTGPGTVVDTATSKQEAIGKIQHLAIARLDKTPNNPRIDATGERELSVFIGVNRIASFRFDPK